MSTTNRISEFYIKSVPFIATAPVNTPVQLQQVTVTQLPRRYFLLVAGSAYFNFIGAVAKAAFFLVASIFTGFMNQGFRNSLFKNVEEIPTYLGAVPVGLLGALFPQMINETVLGIPSGGLVMPASNFRFEESLRLSNEVHYLAYLV